MRRIFLREKGDRLSLFSCSTRSACTHHQIPSENEEEARLTDPMNIAHSALREIIINNQLDALEIQSSRSDVCTNETPNPPLRESSDDLIPLLRCSISIDRIDRNSIESQFIR